MNTTTQLEGTQVHFQTVPGSGFVGVTLRGDVQRHYNPMTGKFNVDPLLDGAALNTTAMETLVKDLDVFVEKRKHNFAGLN